MDKKKTAVKVGVGAAASAATLKGLAGAGLLKGGWLIKTALTMFVSLALYANIWGWGFAGMVILLLLIHEMGHWIWMKAKGLDPQAPIFLPFVGAFVAMDKLPPDEATNAWIALAGPLIGGIGALIIYITGLVMKNGTLMAGGSFGFFLNLLQLIPARPLDGSFIAGAVSKWLLWPGTILVLGLGLLSQSLLLILVGGFSLFSLFSKKKKPETAPKNAPQQNPADAALAESPPPTVSASANEQTTEATMKPASRKQRFFIGLAYVSLALVLGIGQVIAGIQMRSNKDYARGQIGVLTEQLKHSSDSDLYRERSQCYETIGKIPEADADMQRVIVAGTDDPDDYISMIRYRYSEGRIDAASGELLKKAAELSQPRTDEAYSVAYAYILGNDFASAQKAAEKCDAAAKDDINAAVYEHTGKPKDAHACYDEAVTKGPPFVSFTICRKALMELSEGELPRAKVDLDAAKDADPDDALTHLTEGWYHFYDANAQAALSSADQSVHALEDPLNGLMDRVHVIAACHRLRAAAAAKLSNLATTDTDRQKYQQLATSEMAAFKAMPGFDLFVPRNVDDQK